MQFGQYDVQLLDEKKKKGHKKYWFPHWVKFIAWILTLASIVICSFYLILYGLTFGLLKCYLWLTAVTFSLIMSCFFVQPVKIFVLTAVVSAISKTPPTLHLKTIHRETLENKYDAAKAFHALKYRLDNTHLYSPVPLYKLQSRAENIKYHLEQRKLFVEVSIYTLFMIALLYLVLAHRSWAIYYTTNVAAQLCVYGSYTNTIPFTAVKTYDEFIQYLNETLLPSVLGNSSQNTKLTYRRRRSLVRLFDPWHHNSNIADNPWENDEIMPSSNSLLAEELNNFRLVRQNPSNISQQNVTSVYERGWTMDHSVKLVGKMRLRQLRVKNNSCEVSKYIKPRENMCFAPYSRINEEKGSFTIWWKAQVDDVLTPTEKKPWTYDDSWFNGGVYLSGKHSSYPGGGYILEMAKDLDDSRVILNYLDTFQWIDARTRVVIIELTLYSVNVNLFSVVHLIAERSATGYFITSHQIQTAKFMFLDSEFEVIFTSALVLFSLLIFLFAYRQAIRVGRTSFHSYITKGNPFIDIMIITFGLISAASIYLRSYYVSSLLKTLERSQNNTFVSFALAAVWNSIATYILALLVILTAMKIIQILQFRVVFLQMIEILRNSYRYFLALSLHLLVVLLAFAICLHLILALYDYQFSTVGRTFSKLIGLIACLGTSCETSVYQNTPWYLAPIFYAFFLLFILILGLVFFASVICYYLGRIKNTRIENKYNALAYLRHILTANEKSDILRLKGGGGSCSNLFVRNKADYQFPPQYLTDPVVIKRGEPIFTREKVYDFQISHSVDDLNRFKAMKIIIKTKLSGSNEMERESLMKTVVAARLIASTHEKGRLPEKFYKGTLMKDVIELNRGKPDPILTGRDKTRKLIVSSENLLNMKQVVEDYGRKKMFEKYEQAGLTLKIILEDELLEYAYIISALDQKITELMNLVNEKYKQENGFTNEPTESNQEKK